MNHTTRRIINWIVTTFILIITLMFVFDPDIPAPLMAFQVLALAVASHFHGRTEELERSNAYVKEMRETYERLRDMVLYGRSEP